MVLPGFIVRRLLRWSQNYAERHTPSKIIRNLDGSDYMLRWHLIRWKKLFSVFIHNIRSSDDDRALHDHPFWNASVLLDGTYKEWVPVPGTKLEDCKSFPVYRPTGSVVLRLGKTSHRLELFQDRAGKDEPTWSIFIAGPYFRRWGFWCLSGWVSFEDFTALGNGKSSRGCD